VSVSQLPDTAGVPPLRPITGPSALTGDVRRFVHLTWTLAVQEFKLAFFGSMLGYLWSLMRPLMLFGVLYVVFTQFVKVSDHPLFPVSLLLGIVLFTFFAEATSGAVTSVVDREALVRKIQFPRLAIPLAVVLTALFNLGLNLVVVFIFGVILGVSASWSWLELPVLIVLLALFAVGCASLLSALYVRFRDLRPIWDVVLQVMFYGSLIIVPFETVFERFETLSRVLMANPLAAIVQQGRHAVVDETLPSAASAIGSTALVAVPLAIVLGVFALGLWVFTRQAPRIAEEL
jgi:ABC-2 type transport system permease protein